MRTRILFIDDELDCLDHLKAVLASKAEIWDLEFSNNPEQALESVKENPPSIVMADHHMPQMDGIDLLKAIEQAQPSTQRFIFADPEEQHSFSSSIGSSFHFLPKPCPADMLISEIQRALAVESWLGSDKIKAIVNKVDEFPTLPPMYLKVVNALNSKDPSAVKIGQAIMGDLAISAKILQIVNSSFFGLEEKVSDIVQGVSVLGIDTVKNLVLAIQVYGKASSNPDQRAITDQLWHHSMSVATAAKRIMQYETQDSKRAEEAYTAGLFHDIGKLIMLNVIPDEYNEARARAQEENIPMWQAENRIVGCNHADVGAYLLGRWGMPVTVVEPAASHHEPINSFGNGFSPLAAVHAANSLVWERHPGEEAHPDSLPDHRYLAEVGHASSWEAWQQVAKGKLTEKRVRKLKLPAISQDLDQNEATSSEDEGSAPISESPETQGAEGSVALKKEQSKKPTAIIGTGLGLAACAAFAVWIGISSNRISNTNDIDSLATSGSLAAESFSANFDDDMEQQPEPSTTELALQELAVIATEEPAPEAVEQEEAVPAENDFTAIEKSAEPIDRFPRINLTGIFFNVSHPAASVNGKILKEGQNVQGATITKIEKKSIYVDFEGESRTFKLKQ